MSQVAFWISGRVVSHRGLHLNSGNSVTRELHCQSAVPEFKGTGRYHYEKRKFVRLIQTDLDLQIRWIFD